MSRIAFRPTKDRLGGYCFSIDAIGHVEDERIADALKRVVSKQPNDDLS